MYTHAYILYTYKQIIKLLNILFLNRNENELILDQQYGYKIYLNRMQTNRRQIKRGHNKRIHIFFHIFLLIITVTLNECCVHYNWICNNA